MDFGGVLNKIIRNNQRIFIHYGVVTARTNTNTRISVQISTYHYGFYQTWREPLGMNQTILQA
jgi:hypothetical protein